MSPAMDNAEPYDLVTVLSRLEDLRGMTHEIGRHSTETLSGRVSSGKSFGDFGLTVRHHVRARPPCLITNY
jgi:hypothetical protein